MMMLRFSSRARGYVERRETCMSTWRLRSSSSMPFWTTAIFTRSDRTSVQDRSYRRIFTSNSSNEPRTSPLKVWARTSSNRDVSLPAVAGSYSATSRRQLSNPSPSPACSSNRPSTPLSEMMTATFSVSAECPLTVDAHSRRATNQDNAHQRHARSVQSSS